MSMPSSSETPTIDDGAISLRPFADTDTAVVIAAAADPYIPLITTVPTSATHADALAFIARQRDRFTDGTGYSFAIANHDGTAVGQIGLWTRDIHHSRASIGYWVAPGYRGHGYAVRALRTLSRWALDRPDIMRLELLVEPSNTASIRTAERAGYLREGLLRSWRQIGDERRDLFMYGRI